MGGFYNSRAEKERKARETPERILKLAKEHGQFRVSLRYRDDWLRSRCTSLKHQGKLTGPVRVGGCLVYYPVKEGDHATEIQASQ